MNKRGSWIWNGERYPAWEGARRRTSATRPRLPLVSKRVPVLLSQSRTWNAPLGWMSLGLAGLLLGAIACLGFWNGTTHPPYRRNGVPVVRLIAAQHGVVGNGTGSQGRFGAAIRRCEGFRSTAELSRHPLKREEEHKRGPEAR